MQVVGCVETCDSGEMLMSLWVDSVDKPRKRYCVSYVVEFADPRDYPFQTKSET